MPSIKFFSLLLHFCVAEAAKMGIAPSLSLPKQAKKKRGFWGGGGREGGWGFFFFFFGGEKTLQCVFYFIFRRVLLAERLL